MNLAAYLPLVLPALSAPLAAPVAERLNPRHATWVLTGAAAILAACSTFALALLAAAGLVRIPVVESLGRISPAVLAPASTQGTAVSLLAAALLACATLTASTFTIRRYRALAGAYREARCLRGPEPMVVIDDQSCAAYALPGRPGRIVVTAGMLAALDRPGRAALVAHEQAHLADRHYLFTSIAGLAAAANPLLRPVARAVDYTVERWADEHAARVIGNRRLVARTIGSAALAATARPAHRTRPAALAITCPQPRGVGPIPRRVAAMLAPAPPRRLALAALILAAALLAGMCALNAANQLQDLLAIASSY